MTLRLDIAAAREHAELVEALEGSVLWLRLLKSVEGVCAECGYPTERWGAANEDFCCEDCCERIVRGQEEDKRLDSPTYGQAEWINGQR